MLDNPSIKAIINARGGYGSTRIIDRLDFTEFKKNPKWIIGFSDITAIHLKLQSMGYQSLHATMPIFFTKPNALESLLSLKSFLFADDHAIHFHTTNNNRHGRGEGKLIGGNLSLITDSIGTPSEVMTDGKILVIEEIDEYLYKIDRMMVHLKRSGKLAKLSGLVVGHMTDLLDTEIRFGETYEQIILNHTREYDYPVCFNFPSGHDAPNLAWPSGAHARLEVTANNVDLYF